MKYAFRHRVAFGAWINDMRNRALPRRDWPCVLMDEQTVEDVIANIEFQAASGFNALDVFGLFAAGSWLPDIPRTISEERKRKVQRIVETARDCGMRIIYGLGVYSWGFDRIIASDAAVRGTNPHAMCASRAESWRWMRRLVDFLLSEFDFGGFHLEASDQGRCSCPTCSIENDVEYYSRINARTAEYVKARRADAILMVNMCGYRPWGETVPREDWTPLKNLSRHLDSLIDPGHAGYFIAREERRVVPSSGDAILICSQHRRPNPFRSISPTL